jgi:hypothetical protein
MLTRKFARRRLLESRAESADRKSVEIRGIGEGPYLVLPIFGPSNVRDAIGVGLGFVLDPLGSWVARTQRMPVMHAALPARSTTVPPSSIRSTK